MNIRKVSEKILVVSICVLFILSAFPNMIITGKPEGEDIHLEEGSNELNEMNDGVKEKSSTSEYKALEGTPSYHSSKNDMEGIDSMDVNSQNTFNTKNYHNLENAWKDYDGTGTNIGLVDSGVDFANPDIQGSYPVVEDEDSPYYGWPIAFDPKSMNQFLKSNDVSNTWYADTSRVGSGPFNYSQEINLDGDNDFAPSDIVATPGTDGKEYWDLQDLYVSRDQDNWYFGFSTNIPSSEHPANVTNAIFIDSDKGTSGGLYSPKGKAANFNSSHRNTVTDVAYSPNGDYVASCSLDSKVGQRNIRVVKVWDTTNGKIVMKLEGQENPVSLVWTSDGSLVTANPIQAIVWDVSTGDKIETINYYQSEEEYSSIPYRSVLDTHKNSTAPQEEWLAIAGGKNIHLYDDSWNRFSTIYTGFITNGVEFSPDGSYLATGDEKGYLNIFNWTVFDPSNLEDTSTSASPEYRFELGDSVNTLAWKSDGTEIMTGTADGIVSIWTLPKSEANNTLNATEEIVTGEVIEESDDSIGDLQNDHPTTKSPVSSAVGDGWYTHESGENLSVGFDIGSTGGKLIEAYLDIRFDVNDTQGDMSYWNKNYIQIQKPAGDWKGVDQPQPGDNNETVTLDLISFFDYVEQIGETKVRYNFDYSGPTPGPSISFDYINIRYRYIPGKIYQNHSSSISSADWSEDDSVIFSSERGNLGNLLPPHAHIWNPSSRETLAENGLYQPMYAVNWFDSSNFITGSRDSSIREWNSNLQETRVFRQNIPNHAIFVNLTSRYDDREDGYIVAGGRPEFYNWQSGSWNNPSFLDIKGSYSTGEDSSFIEISIPREQISGDPQFIDVQMVSFGRDMNKIKLGKIENTEYSHAQDSVPADVNVFDRIFKYGTIKEDDIPNLHLAENTVSSWGTLAANEADDAADDLTISPTSSPPHDIVEGDGWFTAAGGKNISLGISSGLPAFKAAITDVELKIHYGVNAAGGENMGANTMKYIIDGEEYDTGLSFATGDDDNNVTVSLDNVNKIAHLDNLDLYYSHSGSATLNIDHIEISYDYPTKATSLSAFEPVYIPKYTINLNTNQSISGSYHFGMHPSELMTIKRGKPGLLVVDRNEENVYDTVIVDLNMDYVFTDDDITLDKDNPIDYLDNYNATVPFEDEANLTTPDGFPDISSGLLYFISNATKNVSDPLKLSDFNKDNETIVPGENISTFPNILKVYKNGELWDKEYIYLNMEFSEEKATLEFDGNIREGTLRITGEKLPVENRSVYQASGGDKEFILPHKDISDLELYYNGTMEDWERLDILVQTEGVKDWSNEKYDDIFCAVNSESGVVDFNPAFRLYPDDKIYATYNWTGELEEGADYDVDYSSGKVSFTDNIGTQSKLTVKYTFDHWSVRYDEDEKEYLLKLTEAKYGDKLDDDDQLVMHYSINSTALPGSEEQARLMGVDNNLPGNGDLVCFMGDFDDEVDILEEESGHGTEIASILVGDGSGYDNAQRLNNIVDNMNDPALHPNNPFSVNQSYSKVDIPKIEGVAPGAKIIPIGNAYSDLYSSWNFLVKGYDGEVNTGDEADIITNPYNIEDEQLAGWDDYSRKAEVAMLQNGESNSLFIGSAGYEGPGYGSIVPPGGAPHMLTVGYANVEVGEIEGPNSMGVVVPNLASKGPTPMGYPKPEIVALGKYNASMPLHKGYSAETSDGSSIYPTYPRDGVDISCAIVTGIAALAHGASSGGFNLTTGRSLMMSASNTTNTNTLREGSGLLDARTAVDIASGSSGFRVDTPVWVPGDFNGENIDGFSKMVRPGDTIEKQFNVEYMGGSSSTSVSQGTFTKIGNYQFEDRTYSYTYEDMLGRNHQMYDRSTGFVMNETGLFKLNSDPEDQMMIKDEVEHYQKSDSLGDEFGVQAYPTSEKVMDFNLSEEPDMIRIKASSPYSEIYDSNGNLANNFAMASFNWENRMGEYLEHLKTTNAPAINGAQQFSEMSWIQPTTNISSPYCVDSVDDIPVTGRVYVFTGDSVDGHNPGFEIYSIDNSFQYYQNGNVDLPDYPMSIDTDFAGGFSAVAVGNSGLQLVDVSDIDNPTLAGSVSLGTGFGSDVEVVGNYAYIADYNGISIVDITNINSPSITGQNTTSNMSGAISINGNYAYLATTGGMEVFDISDRTNPQRIATYGAGYYFDVFVDKADPSYLYLSNMSNIKVIDISTPSSPSLVSTISIPMATGMDMAASSNMLTVAVPSMGYFEVDVSDRSNPSIDRSEDAIGTYMDVSTVNLAIYGFPDVSFVAAMEGAIKQFNSMGSPAKLTIPTATHPDYSYTDTNYDLNPLNLSINSPLWTSGVYGNMPECNFPTLTRYDQNYPLRTFNLSGYESNIDQPSPTFDYMYNTDGTEELYELNRIDYDISSNTLTTMIDNPGKLSTNGGLFVYLTALTAATENANWTFEVEFFKEKPHDWIGVDSSVSTSSDSGTFTATLDVPEDAKPGSYEAAIKLETGGKTTKIPVLINVMSDRMTAEFGGEDECKYLYSNSHLSGVSGDEKNSGDWRYYYINVPDDGRYKAADEGIKMVTEVDWTKRVDVYTTSGSGDTSVANIHGEPDDQYAELAPGDKINLGGFDVSSFDSRVHNVKIMVKHKYSGTVPEVDSNNLTLTYSKEGSSLDINVTENTIVSELDITWDSHKHGAPTWNWALVGGTTIAIEHKVRGLPGDGNLLIDSVWMAVETKNVVDVKDDVSILTSDLDIQVLQPTSDFGTSKGEGVFGKGVSASASSIGDNGETNTNTTRSVFGTSVVPGLNVIAVRNTRVDGEESPYEHLSGDVFPLEIKPVPGDVNTNEMLSKSTFKFLPGMEINRFNASAVGPAQSESLSGVPIPQDDFAADWWNSITFVELLATKSTYHKHISVENALSLEISCWDEDGASDVDLGLFRDANGNGVPEVDEFVKYSGVGGSDEHIKIMNPPDGEYILAVLGYTTADPGYIGLKISVVLAGVEGYELGDVPRQPIGAFEEGKFDLMWNFPGDAEDSAYGGVINVGIDDADDIITIPLNVFLDTNSPQIKDTSPEPNDVVSEDKPPILASYTDIIKERTTEKRKIYVGELKLGNASADDWVTKERTVIKEIEGVGVDTSNIWIKLDNENITTYTSIREDGTMSYIPTKSMEDGIHFVSVKAKDRAGNMQVHNWSFEIDTTLPDISLTGDLTRGMDDILFTNKDVLPISGSLSKDTENLELTVKNNTGTMTKQIDIIDSSFEDEIILHEDGMHELIFTATDRVDNSMEEMITVYKDTVEPDITITSPRITDDIFSKEKITFKGEIDRKEELGDVGVYINNVELNVMADGYFEHTVTLEEGDNEFEIVAVDEAGNTETNTRNLEKDTVSPSIDWDYEQDGNEITISGSVDEEADVMINGKPIAVSGDSFSSTITLRKNSMNEVIITAEDEAGNVAQSTRSVDLTSKEEGMSGSMMGAIIAAIVIALLAGLLLGFKVLPMFLGKEEEETVIEEEEEEVPIEEEMEEEEAITDEEGEELEEELFGEEEEVGAEEEVTEEDIFGEPEEGEELEEDFEEETVEEEVIDEELEEGEIEPEPEEETEEQALEEPGGTEETIDEEAMNEEVEESEDKVDVDLDEEKTDEL